MLKTSGHRLAGPHTTAIASFRLSAVFLVGSGLWSGRLWINGGGNWWGPLHLFVVGGVLLAVSGATQLFSLTWGAAVPGDYRIVVAQRWLLALGAAGAVAGVTTNTRWIVGLGAVMVAGALAGLGWILVSIVRRSLVRRVGIPGRFYFLAIVAGVVGVSVGGLLGATSPGAGYLDLRTVHMHLNLVGLVGFTILGTIPTLLPTTLHRSMVSGREAILAFHVGVAATVAMGAGIFFGPQAVGVGSGLALVAWTMVLGGLLLRLGVAWLARGGLSTWFLISGTLWIMTWLGWEAVTLVENHHSVYARHTILGVGGVVLVLFGSLAYLIPVLARSVDDGRAPVMTRFAVTRSLAANAALVMLVAGWDAWAPGLLIAVLLVDFALRTLYLVWKRRSGQQQLVQASRRDHDPDGTHGHQEGDVT